MQKLKAKSNSRMNNSVLMETIGEVAIWFNVLRTFPNRTIDGHSELNYLSRLDLFVPRSRTEFAAQRAFAAVVIVIVIVIVSFDL